MPVQVTKGASLICNQGAAPSSLIVLPINRVMVDGKPAATVMDKIPIVNIPSFGVCRSMANPQVAAATSLAMGVLTPMPCIPRLPASWQPGAKKTKIGKFACLTQNSKCTCAWGGSISITKPGAKTTNVA